MTGELQYAYAVCRPFDAAVLAGVTGVAGAPVGQVEQDGLVAVVSPVPADDFAEKPLRNHLEDLDWLAGTARAHESVTGSLSAVTSPLPLRLATVFRDDDSVRDMLRTQRERLGETLERLHGRVEWGVKVYALQTANGAGSTGTAGTSGAGGTAADGTGPGGGRQPASGRDYLRQRRAQRRSQEQSWGHAEEFARQLHHSLMTHADDACFHRLQNSELAAGPGRNVFNAAYLVTEEKAEEFTALVHRTAGAAFGLRVELTGPWAPYSFSAAVEPVAEDVP